MALNIGRDYPAPIATYYDSFQKAARRGDWSRAYWLLHTLNEAVLRYLATIALSHYLERGPRDEDRSRTLARHTVNKPFTMGDYEEILAAILADRKSALFFPAELPELWVRNQGVAKYYRESIRPRNRFAHDGALSVSEVKTKVEEARAPMEQALQSLSFLANYPLVVGTELIISGSARYATAVDVLMGAGSATAHPDADLKIPLPAWSDVPALFLSSAAGDFLPLHPLYTYRQDELDYERADLLWLSGSSYDAHKRTMRSVRFTPLSSEQESAVLREDPRGYLVVAFETRILELLSVGKIDRFAPPTAPPKSYAFPAAQEYIAERSRIFVGRQRELDVLRSFDSGYLVVAGDPGSGKTALLVQLVKDDHVVRHFVGAGAGSDRLRPTLQWLCAQLAGPESAIPDDETELLCLFEALLRKRSELAPITVVIDGLDELEGAEARSLRWLPERLPPRARVIVSTRHGPTFDAFAARTGVTRMILEPLSERDVLEIVERELGSALAPATRREIVEQASGNPLYLRVALERGGKAAAHLTGRVEDLFLRALSEQEAIHGRESAADLMGLILTSGSGLADEELAELLPLKRRDRRGLLSALRPFLVLREGLIAFFHKRFAEVVREQFDARELAEYHRRLSAYFRSKGWSYRRTLEHLPSQLALAREDLSPVLTDLSFLEAKTAACGVHAVLDDLRAAPGLEPLRDAWMANAHLLADPTLIAGQLSASLIERGSALAARFQSTGARRLRPEPEILTGRLPPPLRIIGSHAEGAIACAVAPSGRWLATAAGDGAVRVFDTAGESLPRIAHSSGQRIAAIAFEDDDRLLVLRAAGDLERIVVSTGATFGALAIPSASALARLEAYIVAGGAAGLVCLDPHSLRVLQTFACPPVLCLAASPDRKIFAAGDELGGISLFDGENLSRWRAHERRVTALAFGNEGKLLASGGRDQTINIWSLAERKRIASLTGHSSVVSALAFTPGDENLLSGSYDTCLRLWDAPRGTSMGVVASHGGWVLGLSALPDGRWASTGADNVKLWSAELAREESAIEGHAHWVLAAAFIGEDEFVSVSRDRTARIWRRGDPAARSVLQVRKAWIQDVAKGPGHHQIVTASDDGMIRCFDLDTAREQVALPARTSRAVAASSRGWIAAGGEGGNLLFWREPRGKPKRISLETSWITNLAPSPDGARVFARCGDRSVRIVDLDEMRQIGKLDGASAAPEEKIGRTVASFIACSDDGRLVAAGGDDGVITVWSVESSALIIRIETGGGPVRAGCFIGDGMIAAGTMKSRAITIYELAAGNVVARFVCRSAPLKIEASGDRLRAIDSSLPRPRYYRFEF